VGRELLMRAGVAGWAIALAALVAGCGSSQPAAVPSTAARVALPPAQDDGTLAAAREKLVRRCMAARGFAAPETTAAYRRALLGTPRQIGTLRMPGGAIVTYRSHGCHPHAMGVLYGSVRRYQLLVARANVARATSGAEPESLVRLRAEALERARRIVGSG
jgi:hypothetical protein